MSDPRGPASAARPSRRGRARTGYAWLLLALLLVVSIGLFAFRRDAVAGQARATFDEQVDEVETGMQAALSRYVSMLDGVVELADEQGDLDRDEFLAYMDAQSLAAEYPGVFAIVVATRVEPGELGEFGATITALDERAIVQLADPLIGPPEDHYLLVEHAAPYTLRWNAVGADARAFAPADTALEEAIERGRATMSPAIPQSTLEAVEPAPGEALLDVLAVPIYAGSDVPATADERDAAAVGGVAAAFYPEVLLERARGAAASEVGTELYQGDVESGMLLAASPFQGEPPSPEHGLLERRTFDAAGQEWTLSARALPGLDAGDAAEPWLWLIGSVFTSFLLFVIVYLLLRGRALALDAAAEATSSLRAAEDLFRTAFENAPIGMMLVSAHGAIMRVNRAVCSLLGRSEQDLIGLSVDALVPKGRPVIVDERVRRLLAGELDAAELERRFDTPDGRSVLVAVTLSHVLGREGTEPYLIAQVEDITERQAFEARLAHEATHDPLTGLPNRVLFMDRLEVALQRRDRDGAVPAVLFVDVDDFKDVNDSRGHAVGDEVLVTVADRLRRAMRTGDTVARFGGDEFVVVCDAPDEDEILVVAERIRDAVAMPIEAPGGNVTVGASVGIARADAFDDTAESLLRRADAAMYAAKQQGGDRILVDHDGELRPAEGAEVPR